MTRQNAPKRTPRTFNVTDDKPHKEPAHKKSTGASSTKSVKRSKRKPAIAEVTSVLRTIPDDAAQRMEQSQPGLDALSGDATPTLLSGNKSRFAGKGIFWAALGGLLSLALGLWLDQLIRDLFARQDWLGWLAVGLAGLLLVTGITMIVREARGIMRMARIDSIRSMATLAIADDDMKNARQVLSDLNGLYRNRPDTAAGRAALELHSDAIIDGKNLVILAERDLIRPLDEKARALVMGAAKRVSVVTAISPRALVDIGYVLLENIRQMRSIAELYGGRPGILGFWRLARNIIGHLAVTGSIAVGDGLVQQLVGHGIVAKVSARLGEGVVNGLLTTRIGIAAIDVCRPLPFSDQTRPNAKDFMGELIKSSQPPDK